MCTGKVKWFDEKKGFGFLTTDEGKDVFVHCSAVRYGAKLKADDRVEFEIQQESRGPKAAHVRLLESNAAQPTK